MANYAASNLVLAQASLTQQFNAGELRFRDPVVFKFLNENAQIMIPNYEALRTSEARAVTAYYNTRTIRVLLANRAHDHVGVKGDSAAFTPTWVTSGDKFMTTLKSGDSNVFNSVKQLEGEMKNVMANLSEGLESDAADFIFNNRSGVNAAVSQGTFNAAQDTFEITEATDGDEAIQITKSMMLENKYNGRYKIICDTTAFNKFEKTANQGSGNSTNLGFQFSNVEFLPSVELAALAGALGVPYTDGFWIVIPEGLVTALPWIPIQNRQGHSDGPFVGTYSSFLNPVDGLSYAVHTYMERIDGTAFNSELQDVSTQFEFSIDTAFDHAPLTVANETPILAVAFV